MTFFFFFSYFIFFLFSFALSQGLWMAQCVLRPPLHHVRQNYVAVS